MRWQAVSACKHFGCRIIDFIDVAGSQWRLRREIRSCVYCGQLLPMGPANDTTEIAVEIRAAEIVAISRETNLQQLTLDEYEWFVHGDSPAFTNSDESDGRFIPTTDEQRAGLLAYEIEHHAAET